MTIQIIKPIGNAQRHLSYLRVKLTKKRPERRLINILKQASGRNNRGKVTVRHRSSGHKKYYRLLDFKRDKRDILASVKAIEYDPNRTANIALLVYQDGEKRYILAPDGLKVGQAVIASETADFKVGNALPLKKLPLGVSIHNIELRPGKGAQIVRSAGNAALIQSKEGGYANVLLPSTQIRQISLKSYATVGQVSNQDWQHIKLGKAGRKRHMGIRPTVRGSAMSPNAHPHGGGEGRSGVGFSSPKSKWGKKTLGKKTRKLHKYSDKWIVKNRRKK